MLRVLRRTGLVIAIAVLPAAPAQADPPAADPLPAARALFADALRDEETGRFADALDKFERVRAVRDTASVEYRIGSCQEGLGQPVPAYRAYLAARTLASNDPQSADIARAASGRLDALSKQVAQLAITPAAGPEPPPETPPASTPAPPAPASPSSPNAVEAPPPRNDSAIGGWIAVGGGVGFLTASAILLVARQNDIADLKDACPGGLCPVGAPESDLESTRHRAEIYGPVGVACGIAGLALAGAGVYWIASAHRPSTASRWTVVPMVARAGAGLAFTGALP